MGTKQALILLLQHFQGLSEVFANLLSPQEIEAQGAFFRNWTAKDTLGHCTYWVQFVLANIAAERRGEAPQSSEDFDALNGAAYQERAGYTWAEIQTESQAAYAELIALVQELSIEQLLSPDIFQWQKGEMLWLRLAGNAAQHPLSHLTGYLLKHDHAEAAVLLHEQATPRLTALSDAPSWRGLVIYDQGCTYALAGQKEKALTCIGEAFSLLSKLRGYAQLDPDLASIRSDPEFERLSWGV